MLIWYYNILHNITYNSVNRCWNWGLLITANSRGHAIYYDGNFWRYIDNDDDIHNNKRACTRCGQFPTSDGFDHCLGRIEGAISACCGHGIDKPYLVIE